MEMPLLHTKLYIPSARSELVSRSRLTERLSEGLSQKTGFGRKLTLVSAPAGFGKTTLVSDWVQQLDYSVAWLSLDEGDNDLARFLSYFIVALQQVEAKIGQTVQSSLQTSPLPPVEALMTTLVNDLLHLAEPIIFVLDDYHLINARPIHDALIFLLEHIPPTLCLTITTRADPPFPFARLRTRREMMELREQDLRFTVKEATDFFNQTMALNLTAENIATLETRTEGWIAGLQLVALSLQQQATPEAFITTFAGDDQYIVEYLVEEVFNQQSAEIQDFLLQTSILQQMNAALCDMVTGQHNSHLTLEHLQQANLFVIPLDTKRQWYRYHHLFADLLQHRLYQQDEKLAQTLHLRAAQWHLEQGYFSEAIYHVIRSKHEAEIEHIFIDVTKQSIGQGQHRQALRWFNQLPETRYKRYRLLLFEGYLHIFLSQIAEVRSTVAKIVAQMPNEASSEDQRLLAGLQGFLADEDDNLIEAISYYETALDGLPPTNDLIQNTLRILLGLTRLRTDNLETGFNLITDTFQYTLHHGDLGHHLNSLVLLSSLFRRKAGSAMDHAIRERIIAEFEAAETEPPPDLSWVYSALSQEHYYRNDLEIALTYAQKGLDVGKDLGALNPAYLNAQALRAVIYAALHRDTEAEKMLDEIITAAQSVPEPMPTLMASVKILFLLRQGDVENATLLANRLGLSPTASIAPILDYAYLIYARLLIAQAAYEQAEILLKALAETEENLGHPNRIVTVCTLQASLHQKLGDQPAAIRFLEQAVQLAANHNYVRLFLDEDPSIAQLLPKVKATAPDFVDHLLKAYGQTPPSIEQPLIEPLSDRELEVLSLVEMGFSNNQISAELVVTLGTTKKHLSNIFGKLNVNSRTQAVASARELNLL